MNQPANIARWVASRGRAQHGSAVDKPAQRSFLPALSLLQPWPHMIFRHFKRIENRSWSTGIRGTVLIHASQGKRLVTQANLEATRQELRGRGWDGVGKDGAPDIAAEHRCYPFHTGGIVGVSNVSWCTRYRAEAIRIADELNPELPVSQAVYADPESKYFFVFGQVAEFSCKIPFSGSTMFFRVPRELVQDELDKLNWKVK